MRLSIIIVNYNGRAFILDCIKCIAENPPNCDYDIIVVDNSSTDGSALWMQSEEFRLFIPDGSKFKLILSDLNVGFGRANNMAFEVSNSDVFFILNPDCIIIENIFQKLLEVLYSSSDIYMVAPEILDSEKSRVVSVWNGNNNLFRTIVQLFHFDKIFPSLKKITESGSLSNTNRQVDVVSGAAMMVKKELVQEIGGFDPDFFMYGEDLELCMRVKKFGKKIYYVPEVSVIHAGGKSTSSVWDDLQKNKKLLEGQILFNKKTLSPVLYRLNLFLFLFHSVIIYVYRFVVKGKFNSFFAGKYYFRALIGCA